MSKDFRKIPINRLHLYAGLDADCTLRIALDQRAYFSQDFQRTWRTVMGPANWALGCMERWGALASEANIRRYDAQLVEDAARHRANLVRHKLPETFNPRSPDQLKDLVFGQMALKSKGRAKKTATGKLSLDAETLQGLITDRWEVPFNQATGLPEMDPEVLAQKRGTDESLDVILSVIELKDALNQRSKYGVDYLKHVGYDGRVHTTYKIARTLRTTCIARGTPIEVVRDVSKQPKGVPIEEVQVGDLVYCFDDGLRLALRRVLWAGKTGTQRVVRLHWQGGGRYRHQGYVDLTPDHRVRLRDGSWRRADALAPGDRMLALTRGVVAGGYARLWPTGQPEVRREHRFIWAHLHPGEALPEHVHHEDENPLNNLPGNLVGKTAHDHVSGHGKKAPTWLKELRTQVLLDYQSSHPEQMKDFLQRAREAVRLNLTQTQVLRALEENGWSMVKASRKTGIDYATLKGYAAKHKLPLRVLRRLAKPSTWSDRKRANHPKRYEKLGPNHEVVRVEVLEGAVGVYDLQVEGVHNFIAGGICVHNSSEPNLQNLRSPDGSLSKEQDPGVRARGIYVPPKGWVVISLDYGQFELRVGAWLSGDQKMALALEGDFHTATAQGIFGKVGVSKGERRIGKETVFGTAFGQTAQGLALKLGCTVDRAQGYINGLLVTYPNFATWRKARIIEAVRDGQVFSKQGPFVVRRRLPEAGEIGEQRAQERMRKHAENIAVNTPIQSTANQICLVSMYRVVRWLKDHPEIPAELNLNVHDALVMYVRKDWWRRVAEKAKALMLAHDTGSVRLKVDVEIGEEDYGHLELVKDL